jgi:FG-GAP repeat
VVRAAGGSLSMVVSRVGRGEHLSSVGFASLVAHANRVTYDREALSEWYAAGPLGIEQGFTIARRPAGAAGPLTLALALGGSLHARLAGSQVSFLTPSGRMALRYGALAAVDAGGRRLPASLTLSGHSLLLHVSDRGARYPVRIDPFIQQGSALAANSGEESGGQFGFSVALSADGSTALIGGYSDNKFVGAAWVFTRSGSTWTQQGPKLTGGGEIGEGAFGWRVALSSDGNTALISGLGDNGKVGAAWVFTRSGSTWTQQAELTAKSGEETGKGEFGEGAALSSDGNTALIGAFGDNAFVGAAWVFTRSGSTWTQQGAKLTGKGEIGTGEFGTSAALSADGNTALIGGSADNIEAGAAWVFTRSASTWAQSAKLTGSEETGKDALGYSVALSADGNTALVGGPFDQALVGAAWAFTRSSSTWAQQGGKLTPSDVTGGGRVGWSVALSADGNTALVGGPFDNLGIGAAWMYTRSGSGWAQQGAKLTGGGETGLGHFGDSVALSSDGDTAVIGGPGESTVSVGQAWVFVNPPPSATTGAASGIGTGTATLNGTVGAGASSAAYFQYGTSVAYGISTPGQGIGASTSSGSLSAVVGGLSPATTYHFRIVAENSGGVSYGADQTFTTALLPIIIPGPTPPSVTNAAQSHRIWRESNKLAHISRKRKPPVGTTFSFTLNEPASVSFAFTQQVAGRKVNGKCVAQTKANRRKHACKRTVTQGTLSFTGHARTNKVSFQGRISRSKKLRPGTYTLIITATSTAGQRSSPRQLTFTIVKLGETDEGGPQGVGWLAVLRRAKSSVSPQSGERVSNPRPQAWEATGK